MKYAILNQTYYIIICISVTVATFDEGNPEHLNINEQHIKKNKIAKQQNLFD